MSVSSPLRADLRFLTDVAEELDRARKTYPDMQSLYEGYAVLLEKMDDFFTEAKWKAEARRPEQVRRELVQIAAMAVRTAVDVLDD